VLNPSEEIVEPLIRKVLGVFEQAAAEPLDIPVIAGGIATGGAFPDPAARAVLVDAQPAAAMALPQAEGGAMGPKDGVGAVDRGAEARHGRPDSLLEGSDVKPFVRGRRQPPRGSEMFGGKPPNK
jgi:hypothetical protein